MKKIEDKTLWFFLVVALVTIAFNDFIFDETPEIISKGDEIGNFLSNLSLAYISSLIFYYIVVVRKEYNDKLSIYKTVTFYCDQLIGRSFSIYDMIAASSGIDSKGHDHFNVTKELFFEMCNSANPKDIPKNRFLGTPDNLIQANCATFIYHNSIENANHLINKIFIYMPFLDTEYIEKINKLKTSIYWLMAPALIQNNTNTNYAAFSEPMWDYILLLRELNELNSKLKSKYNLTIKT